MIPTNRRALQRGAIVAMLRDRGEVYGCELVRDLPIRYGRVQAVLRHLMAEGVVTSRVHPAPTPASYPRISYRLVAPD